MFGNVSYARIDTDKYKKSIGCGRISFSTYQSYTNAVAASLLKLKLIRFAKKIKLIHTRKTELVVFATYNLNFISIEIMLGTSTITVDVGIRFLVRNW